MRVKVFRAALAAGPDGVVSWPEGWEGEVADDVGAALVRGHYASVVEMMAPPGADTVEMAPAPVAEAGFRRRGRGRAR